MRRQTSSMSALLGPDLNTMIIAGSFPFAHPISTALSPETQKGRGPSRPAAWIVLVAAGSGPPAAPYLGHVREPGQTPAK
jgi:hypothetical protein